VAVAVLFASCGGNGDDPAILVTEIVTEDGGTSASTLGSGTLVVAGLCVGFQPAGSEELFTVVWKEGSVRWDGPETVIVDTFDGAVAVTLGQPVSLTGSEIPQGRTINYGAAPGDDCPRPRFGAGSIVLE